MDIKKQAVNEYLTQGFTYGQLGIFIIIKK